MESCRLVLQREDTITYISIEGNFHRKESGDRPIQAAFNSRRPYHCTSLQIRRGGQLWTPYLGSLVEPWWRCYKQGGFVWFPASTWLYTCGSSLQSLASITHSVPWTVVISRFHHPKNTHLTTTTIRGGRFFYMFLEPMQYYSSGCKQRVSYSLNLSNNVTCAHLQHNSAKLVHVNCLSFHIPFLQHVAALVKRSTVCCVCSSFLFKC